MAIIRKISKRQFEKENLSSQATGPNTNELNARVEVFENNPLKFDSLVVFTELVLTFDGATNVDPSTDLITITGHSYPTNLAVKLSGGTRPVPLDADPANTVYYVIFDDANNIKLAREVDGNPINITVDGSGTITVTPQFVVPDNVTRIYAEVCGSGGGAAGGGAGGVPGSGGGGGGIAEGFITVSPSDAIAVVIGTGGTGGTGSANGNNGNNTTFSTFTGNGGEGGFYTNTIGGNGGFASGGDLNTKGGTGGSVSDWDNTGAGGGFGGSNKRAGGTRGSTSGNGIAGDVFGGGGSGPIKSAGALNGGAGGSGGAIIWY